jgi:phage-related minor tail protein
MGEAGPEAILPLKRGSSGKLGVEMHGGRGGGGTTNVNYTGPTLNFNGDEYVPRSAVGGIINAAAKQGASMGETATIRSLQNNRSSRSRIGMR